MVRDPIADFVTRINNAQAVQKASVSMPYSNFKAALAAKLSEMGLVGDVSEGEKKGHKELTIELSYDKKETPKINKIEQVSKPGRRLYTGHKDVRSYMQGKGAYLISTPEGIKTDSEARTGNVGGELVLRVW